MDGDLGEPEEEQEEEQEEQGPVIKAIPTFILCGTLQVAPNLLLSMSMSMLFNNFVS